MKALLVTTVFNGEEKNKWEKIENAIKLIILNNHFIHLGTHVTGVIRESKNLFHCCCSSRVECHLE